MERSAMGNQQRQAILANEVIRRLSNVGQGILQCEKTDIVDKMTLQMKNSGYNRSQCVENLSDDHITMQCHCHETAATLSRSLSLSHAARAPSVNPGLKLTQNIVSVKLSQQLSTASPPVLATGP